MKLLFKFLFASVLLCPQFSFAQQAEDSIARHFLDLNKQGNFDEAVKLFDNSVAGQVTPVILRQIWEQFGKQFGNYLQADSFTVENTTSRSIIVEAGEFEKAMVDLSFAFTPAKMIGGFHIIKVTPKKAGFYSGSSSFKQEDDTLHIATGNIYGTLMLPDKEDKIPVALIIAGSGPTDRNGNNPMGENSNSYKLLAEGLAQNGIATLRYDKRGVGESRQAMLHEKDIRFDDYIHDAAGWIKSLEQDPRFSKVIVMGHSEGSLIGMIAAREADASAYISLAGAGRSIDQILLTQLKSLPPSEYAKTEAILTRLKSGETDDSIPRGDATLQSLFRPAIQPYLISWIKYDPAVEIAKLNMPVLIVNGKHDIQVPVSEAEILHQADPKATLLLIDHMSHILKDAPAEREANVKTYSDPSLPLDKQLVQGIVEFITKVGS